MSWKLEVIMSSLRFLKRENKSINLFVIVSIFAQKLFMNSKYFVFPLLINFILRIRFGFVAVIQ